MATYVKHSKTMQNNVDLNATQNLVHPEWELADPTPDVFKLFQGFNVKFFQGKLACVELEWSKRMYQCAGICYSRKSRGFLSCIIRLSEPLLKLRSRKELIETLLHEMIHAWNFIRGIMEPNGGHGQQFCSKMNEINSLAGTNITVYHSFHDEVELYKKHWWRCEGPCKERKPYYGFVKRTSNRAPGPNDLWWKQHQQTCGGTFIKVKEPTPTKKLKNKENDPKPKKSKVAQPNSTQDIRNFFPKSPEATQRNDTVKLNEGTGVKLGGAGTGRSRLLDMFDKSQKDTKQENLKKRKLESQDDDSDSKAVIQPRKSIHSYLIDDFENDDDIILIDDEFDDTIGSAPVVSSESIKQETKSSTCNCPVCNASIAVESINSHLDECLTLTSLAE